MYKIEVDIKSQMLSVFKNDRLIKSYLVSTGKNGTGECEGSGCTPRGRHIIRAKIGHEVPINGVFVGRRFTGEIFSYALREKFPQRDWILTRILWLSGMEPGRNRLGKVDTMRRYIYIHGTPPDTKLGEPGSKGCIRMANEDILALFNQIPVGSEIYLFD